MGEGCWPYDLNAAYALLNNWKGGTCGTQRVPGGSDGVTFANVDGDDDSNQATASVTKGRKKQAS